MNARQHQLQAEPAITPAEMYERFYVPAMFAPLATRLLARLSPRPGATMLDLACGTGIVARTAAPLLGQSGHIRALDLRPGMVESARAIPAPDGAPIEWMLGDATALDLPTGSFDVVTCQQGLQFFPDRPKALLETRRVLRPGGRAAFALWQGTDRQGLIGEMVPIEKQRLDARGIDSSDIETPFSLGDPDELRALLEDAGFRDIEVSEEAIDTDFPAENFVDNVEYAYSAVVPDFVADPDAFHSYSAEVAAGADDMVGRYLVAGRIRFTMHANVAVATA